ncbi:MAG: hypothetical protein KKB70_06730, partial [Proteobacteria bacterium]|nr:hypothetical protein [Pseudomonadota bacterium]
KEAGERAPSRRPDKDADESLDLGEGEHKLVCAACRTVITFGNARTSMNGDHRHVFCNPHGYVFEIGCFLSAPGCRPMGPPSTEFAWFPGHAWQMGECRGCQTQLGWRFAGNNGAVFFGLILDRLTEEADNEEH